MELILTLIQKQIPFIHQTNIYTNKNIHKISIIRDFCYKTKADKNKKQW